MITNWLQNNYNHFRGEGMNEIKDYIVYPDDVNIYIPPTMPAKQNMFYKNLVYVASAVVSKVCIRAGSKIEKINMEGLKPPYMLLSNHMYFIDFDIFIFITSNIILFMFILLFSQKQTNEKKIWKC